jgi:hypothetical protein
LALGLRSYEQRKKAGGGQGGCFICTSDRVLANAIDLLNRVCDAAEIGYVVAEELSNR